MAVQLSAPTIYLADASGQLPSLITDRTASDVAYVSTLAAKISAGTATDEEIAAWFSGLKGAYNAVDLNRVEAAVQYINDYINTLQEPINATLTEHKVAADSFWILGIDPLELTVKTDWSMPDMPEESDLERYLGNVDQLTNRFPIEKDLPVSLSSNFNYKGANEIERALLAVYEAAVKLENDTKQLIANTAAGWVQSGETYGGEF